jgi:hypothetical protein
VWGIGGREFFAFPFVAVSLYFRRSCQSLPYDFSFVFRRPTDLFCLVMCEAVGFEQNTPSCIPFLVAARVHAIRVRSFVVFRRVPPVLFSPMVSVPSLAALALP